MTKLVVSDDLQLRQLQESDAEEVFRLFEKNRTESERWQGTAYGQNLERTRHRIRFGLESSIPIQYLQLGAWQQGALIGEVQLHIDHANKSANLAVDLSGEEVGKGPLTKACRAAIDYAFADLNLHRLIIRCATDDQKTRALAEQFGFRKEGDLREALYLNDQFCDAHLYGLLAREWSRS